MLVYCINMTCKQHEFMHPNIFMERIYTFHFIISHFFCICSLFQVVEFYGKYMFVLININLSNS